MSKNSTNTKIEQIKKQKYEYGFSDGNFAKLSFDKGLNQLVISRISKLKNEPSWMKQIRLKAYEQFVVSKNPKWATILDNINFDDFKYYVAPTDKFSNKWTDIPKKIRDTFKKLKINEEEAKFLSGVNNQYDSEVVFHDLEQELIDKKVIFTNIETAIVEYPDLVKEYFGKLIPYTDNKYAALNTAVWSGGSFVYVPEGVKLSKPLQAYFRINAKSVGQFERTLIIVEKNAQLHYIEGCTAPIYDQNNLHAAVVEIYVKENGVCRYSTIQNWSDNVLNLVTKRAKVEKNGSMEWIDGNIGSKLNMKYPACLLVGENAKGKCISIALSHDDVLQDTGAKMIHLAPNTRSQIISKSIVHSGGTANYRGLVRISKNASNSIADINCDTLILDEKSKSDTIPTEIIANNSSSINHEAKVTDLDKENLFYLNTRGISAKQAKQLLILGFIEPFASELPLEYAVELNRLLKIDIN